jgi:mercuric ion transport protein
MLKDKLLATGIGGAVVAALCCFTPLLVVVFGALGVSAWLGWIDFVLFPALGFFVLLTLYALNRRRAVSQASGPESGGSAP